MTVSAPVGPARPEYLDGQPKRLLIDGEWVEAASGATFPSISPSTGEVLAEVAQGDREDVDRAVAAARRAFDGPWRRFKPAERQRILLRFADLLDDYTERLHVLESMDMGLPVGPAPGTGLKFAAETLRYYAGWPSKIHGETVANSAAASMFTYTLKEPIGVVGSIIPWNGPVHSSIWKMAPVLATGCTMVLKPAEEASLSPLWLGDLVQELDLPPGVVNIVSGFGETAGAALAQHPDVDKIAFTGSTATGQELVRAAAGNLKRLSLELGGKSADIVFADADLDAVLPAAAMGVFHNSGQSCCAGTRLFVERPVYEEVLERLGAFAASLKVGNSLDPTTQIGPVVSGQQLDRVMSYIQAGEAEGARRVVGGTRLVDGDLSAGFFVQPTVFADVADDMRIACEEIFGPVASVMPFDDVDEVIRRANRSSYGLAGGVWTRDVARAHKVAQAIRTGVMWVNTYNQFDVAMPFGGYKMSGWGRELSAHSVDEYLNVKAVWVSMD